MQLPEELVLELFIQSAEAMDYLRSVSVAHRDVRAANFLVESEVPLSIVATDFGLAHLMKHGDVSATTTTLGPVCKLGVPQLLIPAGYLSLDPLKKISCFCDFSVREKDSGWRSRARGAKAT